MLLGMVDYHLLAIPADDEKLAELLSLLGYPVCRAPDLPVPRVHLVHTLSTVGTPDHQEPVTSTMTMSRLRPYLSHVRTVGDLESQMAGLFVAPRKRPDARSIRALLAASSEG